jgi:hypothetical protein
MSSIVPTINSITEITALVLGSVYAAGLLVTSLHLAQYGVTSLPLARAQYLLAGMWCLLTGILPLSIAGIWYGGFSEAFDFSKFPQGYGAWVRAIWAGLEGISAIIGLTLLTVIFTCLVFRIRPFSHVEHLVPFVLRQIIPFSKAWSIAIGSAVAAGIATHAFEAARSAPALSTRVEEISLGLANATVSIVAAFLYIAYFATRIHAIIPQAVGGGRPVPIRLFLGQNCSSDLRSRIEGEGDWRLLLRTPTSYFLLPADNQNRSIELSRELVQGIVALRRGTILP